MTSESTPSIPVSFSPIHAPTLESLALVASEEPPVPLNPLLPGEEGNEIDVDASPDLKAVGEAFGPVGDPNAKRSKRLRGFDPNLTSGMKKPKVFIGIEGGSLDYSSTSYKPSSDDEEALIPHVLVKRDGGPSALVTPSSPVAVSSLVAVASPVTSPLSFPICKHAPVDTDSESKGILGSTTLATFLANYKARAFRHESSQPAPSVHESS